MPNEIYDRIERSGGFKVISKATGQVISTSDSPTAYLSRDKRNRSWATQARPYTKTLGYSDVQTRLVGLTPLEEIYWQRGSTTKPWYEVNRRVGFPWISDSAVTYVESHPSISTTAAKLRCLEAMGEAKWNLALFVAESNEVIDMIASTAKTLANTYKAVRKGKFKKAASLLGINTPVGQARNSWLAYRYGWMPLLGDVASAAEAAASVLYNKPEEQRVLCRGPKGETSTVTRLGANDTQYTHGTGLTSSPRNVYKLERTETKAWLRVRCKSRTLMRLEQFGLANPLALAWELVPFSFVADWFVGIGDYLNAQTALLGLEVLDGGVSTLSTRRLSSQRLAPVATGTQMWSGLEPSYTVESRKYTRAYWSGGVPAPEIDINLNYKRIFDSAALIHAVFGR